MLELYLTYLILLGAARLLFQLSQLATAIIVGGAFMAYVHRKDLASAWLKSWNGTSASRYAIALSSSVAASKRQSVR